MIVPSAVALTITPMTPPAAPPVWSRPMTLPSTRDESPATLTLTVVAGDHVPLARRAAADAVAARVRPRGRRRLPLSSGVTPSAARPMTLPSTLLPVAPALGDEHAGAGVAGDQVALAGARAAHDVVVALEDDAVRLAADGRRAGRVRADAVAVDRDRRCRCPRRRCRRPRSPRSRCPRPRPCRRSWPRRRSSWTCTPSKPLPPGASFSPRPRRHPWMVTLAPSRTSMPGRVEARHATPAHGAVVARAAEQQPLGGRRSRRRSGSRARRRCVRRS